HPPLTATKPTSRRKPRLPKLTHNRHAAVEIPRRSICCCQQDVLHWLKTLAHRQNVTAGLSNETTHVYDAPRQRSDVAARYDRATERKSLADGIYRARA